MSIEDASNWMDKLRDDHSYDYMKTYHYVNFEKGAIEKSSSRNNILSVLPNTITDLKNYKSFTHYKNGAGIKKDISLKTLRKTYISWANQVMGKETGLLTSHSNNSVIEKYYLDPKILSVIEMGALKIRVFGNDSSRNSSRKKKKDLSKIPKSLILL